MNKAKIFSVVNQKGGVGKTTTCINIASSLATIYKNQRILIIDLDPQGNASTGMNIIQQDREKNIYDLLINNIKINDAIKATMIKSLDIVPSTLDLAAAEFELQKLTNWHFILKKILETISHKYDYIFIDCPPSLGVLTINSLVASTAVIIPLQCEFFALEGLSHLLDTIQKVKNHLNPELKVDGVILTMYDRRNNLSQYIEKDVRDYLGDVVYKTIVPRSIALPESSSHGKPIILYKPSSPGSVAYSSLADEINAKYTKLSNTNDSIETNANKECKLEDEYL